VQRSENPLTSEYWLGTVDPRPLGLFRIGLGLAILHDIASLAPQVRVFLTDEGMLPRGVSFWSSQWSVFDLVSGGWGTALVMVLGTAAVLAFTLGFHARVAALLSWVFVVSIHHRNVLLVDGGDMLTSVLLFWSLFAEVGAAYGVDARRRPVRVVDVPAFGLRLLQIQIAILYSGTGRVKMRGGGWLQGDAVFHALQLDGFTRPPGALLGRSPALCKLMTWGTVAIEGLFPVAAFSPFRIRTCRALAFAGGLALQIGILVTMRVGIFTEVMIASSALFLPVDWIDAAERRLRSRGWLRDDPRPEVAAAEPRWGGAIRIVAAVQLVLGLWGTAVSRWVPLPRPLAAEVRLLGVEAEYGMFGKVLDLSRWRADGELEDGSHVDVVSVLAPGAGPTGPGWSFDRWYKVMFKEHERGFPFGSTGLYFCRAWAERGPASPLRSFRLYDDVAPPHAPGDPPAPVTPVVMWKQTCPR
jgi:hypothetical protein